jgi:hypothetical protein
LPDSFDEKQDCDIIVTIVTRLELLNKEKITEIDMKLYVHSVHKDASGGILRQKSSTKAEKALLELNKITNNESAISEVYIRSCLLFNYICSLLKSL